MKNKIIILSSGINGGFDSSIIKDSEKYFIKHNFNVIKANFFKDEKFAKFSFNEYLKYLERLIKKYESRNTELVFIGHSFSALIFLKFILCGRIKSNYKIILWDPSLAEEILKWVEEEFIFISDKKYYYSNKYKMSINKDLISELKKWNTKKLFTKINKEVLIVVAEKGAKENGYYLNKIFKRSKLETIKNANHSFSGYKIRKELFEKTRESISSER